MFDIHWCIWQGTLELCKTVTAFKKFLNAVSVQIDSEGVSWLVLTIIVDPTIEPPPAPPTAAAAACSSSLRNSPDIVSLSIWGYFFIASFASSSKTNSITLKGFGSVFSRSLECWLVPVILALRCTWCSSLNAISYAS